MRRILPETEWERFTIATGGARKFDGVLFERLVRDLLERFFDGDWRQTAVSWDGGRDFVDRSIPSEEQWAECKMYARNIGLRILSPTLVMAVLAGIKRLLFFSYSEINAPARRHLARLGAEQEMSIRLFDGASLDRLIVSAPDVMSAYFGAAAFEISGTPSLSITTRFTTELECQWSDLRGHPPKEPPGI